MCMTASPPIGSVALREQVPRLDHEAGERVLDRQHAGGGLAAAHVVGDVLEGAGRVEVGVRVQDGGRLLGVGAGGAGVCDAGTVHVGHGRILVSG